MNPQEGRRMADMLYIHFNKVESHREKSRYKQAMAHPQKFQHPAGILIHKLASFIMYVLRLFDRWCELGSWGWAGYPFFHQQKTASIQCDKHCSLAR